MATGKKETAEQKLLKMIEASSSESGKTSKQQKKVAKKGDALTLLKACNKFLILGVIIVLVLVALEVKNGITLVNQGVDIPSNSSVNISNSKSTNVIQQKLSYYLASMDARNIFVPYEEAAKTATAKQPENETIVRKTKNFRLVGISWLDRVDTASAMIEDTDQKVTYFLKKGEKIEDVVVKTIYADSVELGFQNEEIIIRYDKSQL